jgi:beta-phosphoglucomutase-like phosphatase (HAD superfamily)
MTGRLGVFTAAISWMSSPAAVILDFDGVIVKSNFVKHKAMLSLFDGYPAQQDIISSYILAHGGVRRDAKIRHILGSILWIHVQESAVQDLLARYAEKLQQLLAAAPLVDGIEAFLRQAGHLFYVSSSAPKVEVREQLSRHGLDACFADVFSADTPKAVALGQISARHPDAACVFFGDSVGDWEAALEANVAFVAVISERDNFASLPVVKLVDFASPSAVHSSIQSALTLVQNTNRSLHQRRP